MHKILIVVSYLLLIAQYIFHQTGWLYDPILALLGILSVLLLLSSPVFLVRSVKDCKHFGLTLVNITFLMLVIVLISIYMFGLVKLWSALMGI